MTKFANLNPIKRIAGSRFSLLMFFFNMWGGPYPPVQEKPTKRNIKKCGLEGKRVISYRILAHYKVKSLSNEVRSYNTYESNHQKRTS